MQAGNKYAINNICENLFHKTDLYLSKYNINFTFYINYTKYL